MNILRFPDRHRLLQHSALVMLLALPFGMVSTEEATALPIHSTANTINPPGTGAPTGTQGGGTRPVENACLRSLAIPTVPLTPLGPRSSDGQPKGLTGSDRPTFVVYTPVTRAKFLEFSLLDDRQNGIYQTTLPVTPGLMSIQLPTHIAALTPGKTYTWTVALVCNPRDRTEDWVAAHNTVQYQPLPPALRLQLQKATPQQQIELYKTYNLIYDAIAVATQWLPTAAPNVSLATLWATLHPSERATSPNSASSASPTTALGPFSTADSIKTTEKP
jgi:hypothetical protein